MNRIMALIIVLLYQVVCSSTQAQNQNVNLGNEVDSLPKPVSKDSEQYGHSIDAELALKKAEALNIQALEYLGMAQPRYDLVIELSDRVSALTNDEKVLATALVNKGKAYEFSGRLDQVLIWYRRASELSHTPEVDLSISRVEDLISTRKNANTPQILNDISKILQRNPLSIVSVKGKEECNALYSKLASIDKSISVVAPFATNLPINSPKLKEYELCRNKPHQDYQFAFEGLLDLGTHDFGLYRIESSDHTDAPREFVYGVLDADALRLNRLPLMAKVDLAACQLQSVVAALSSQIAPSSFGDWFPVVAVNELIKSDGDYYFINLKNVTYSSYLRLSYNLQVFKLNESFQYLCGAIDNLEI